MNEFYVITTEQKFRYLLQGPKGLNLCEELSKFVQANVSLIKEPISLLGSFVAYLTEKKGFTVIDYREARL